MSQKEATETEFERRLRAELRAIVAGRGEEIAAGQSAAAATPAWRRRGPRLGLAAAAVGAVAAAVLIVNASGGDTPSAIAVEAQPEGMVSVEIRSAEDPQGLEQALAETGISSSVIYLPAGTACKEPRFQAASWPKAARAIVVGSPQGAPSGFPVVVGPTPGAPREPRNTTVVGGPEGARAAVQEPADGYGPVTFWISRAAVGAGQTLVVTASAGPEGVFDVDSPIQVALAEGAVSRCEPVPAQPESNGSGEG